jgi:hypothetical protein
MSPCASPDRVERRIEPPTDAELLRRIVAALGEGQVEIEFSPRLQSHLDFPGNSETDKAQFIFAALVPLGLAYWQGSWWLVALAAGFIALAYLAFWRKVVRARVRRRFIARAMNDLPLWRRSWRLSGIVLTSDATSCRSPEGDWRTFAARLPPCSTAPPEREVNQARSVGADPRS